MSDPFSHSTQSSVSDDPNLPQFFNTRRPSEFWLKNPAWIDGASNPPIFFHSLEEIDATLRCYGRNSARQIALHEEHSTPTPVAPPLPSPLTLSLVPHTTAHYRPDQTESSPVPGPYYVHVTVIHTPSIPSTARTKATPKKAKLTKMEAIVLDGISRVAFLEEALKVHDLSSEYSPGQHSGPDFKMSWTGSGGGRGGAPTIHNDKDFEVALEALFAKRAKVQVYIDLDLDTMAGFRIRSMMPSTRPSETGDENEELAYGTRVPKVSDFSEASQIQGTFILQLKQRWPCQQHQGEHGEPGHCYVSPSGAHIRLNPLRFKQWAAAWAAGEVTKHEPPNTSSFDGARDGRLPPSKARGQSGPRAPTAIPSTADDVARFLATIGPALAEVTRKRSLTDAAVRTPPGRPLSKRAKVVSPLPEVGHELQTCLCQFFEVHGIDLTMHKTALVEIDYSPDIIPLVADADLAVILKVTNGVVLKFKNFCKEWFNRYEAKKAAAHLDD